MGAEADDQEESIADTVSGPAEGQMEGAADAPRMATAEAAGTTRRGMGAKLGGWLLLAVGAPELLLNPGCASVLETIAGQYGENLDAAEKTFITRMAEAWLEVKKLMERVLTKYSHLSVEEIETMEDAYRVDAEEIFRLSERYNALRRAAKGANLQRAISEMETNEIEPTMKRFNTFGHWLRDSRAEKYEKKLLQLTDDNLLAEIVSDKPVLIMLTAGWSEESKFAIPIVAKYCADYGGDVKVGMAKVEDEEQTVLMPKFQTRLSQLGIAPKEYPTFYLFVHGNIIAQTNGVPEDPATIERFVQDGLKIYRKQKGGSGTNGTGGPEGI